MFFVPNKQLENWQKKWRYEKRGRKRGGGRKKQIRKWEKTYFFFSFFLSFFFSFFFSFVSFQLAIEEFWGKNPQKSNDYGRIVNNRHWKRVSNLIDEKKVYRYRDYINRRGRRGGCEK